MTIDRPVIMMTFLYLHHRHCKSQDIICIRHLYPSPRAFHSKLKSHLFKHSYPDPFDHSPLQRRWIIWSPWRSFCGCWEVFGVLHQILHYTPTLTAALSPSGPLEIGPELLLLPFRNPPFDSSQRSWISWYPGALGFQVAL